jgi:hypothetical protein
LPLQCLDLLVGLLELVLVLVLLVLLLRARWGG